MEKVKVRVLDYYNRPGYYPYMSDQLFEILENAFLNDQLEVEVPKDLHDQMLEKIKP